MLGKTEKAQKRIIQDKMTAEGGDDR